MSVKRIVPYLYQALRLRTVRQLDLVEAYSLAQGGDDARLQLTQMQLDLLSEAEKEIYFAAQRERTPEERK